MSKFSCHSALLYLRIETKLLILTGEESMDQMSKKEPPAFTAMTLVPSRGHINGTHISFCKNIVYKNLEPQIWDIVHHFKNIYIYVFIF